MQNILIDENLSPSLVSMAHERGFHCSHVNHLGKTGQKDWELKQTIIEGDWTFVTNNSVDFRGPADKPGSAGGSMQTCAFTPDLSVSTLLQG